jgi:hypothetical protein
MANPTDTSKKEAVNKNKNEDPAEQGRKAIEANKKFNERDKSKEQVDREEKKDAEQWRNEG